MYLVKKSIKEHVDALLAKQTFFNGMTMEAERSAVEFPSVTYIWDEFAELDDAIQNGMVTIKVNTKKARDEVNHNKLVQYLKRNLNKGSFSGTDGDDKIAGSFLFNSISDATDEDDTLRTAIIFDVRSFIEEKCCK